MNGTEIADRLSHLLVERTPGHGHTGCDALNPCAPCKAVRAAVTALHVPEQRSATT